MWALVESGSVTAVYTRPKAITLNGIQHPRDIFTRWSADELKAIDIYSYSEQNASIVSSFYTRGSSTVVVDDAAGTVTKTYTHNEKALEDTTEKVVTQEAVDEVPAVLYANGAIKTASIPAVEEESYLNIISTGLKSQKKVSVKATAASLLSGSDWLVIRAAEGGTAVPSDVATYRAAVRTASGTMEAAIDAATDMDAFIALHTDTEESTATLNDWPSIPDTLA